MSYYREAYAEEITAIRDALAPVPSLTTPELASHARMSTTIAREVLAAMPDVVRVGVGNPISWALVRPAGSPPPRITVRQRILAAMPATTKHLIKHCGHNPDTVIRTLNQLRRDGLVVGSALGWRRVLA